MSRLRYRERPGPAPTEDEWDHYRKLREAKEARRRELSEAVGEKNEPGGNSLTIPFSKVAQAHRNTVGRQQIRTAQGSRPRKKKRGRREPGAGGWISKGSGFGYRRGNVH